MAKDGTGTHRILNKHLGPYRAIGMLLLLQFSLVAQDTPAPEPAVGSGKIMVIHLSDNQRYMVDKVQAEFIIKSLDKAEQEGFEQVIITIDTYGGVVMSAREITERLLRLKIPSVAYVETKAISAGAFIAFACKRIVMEKNTTIGDAQMIMQNLEGGIDEAPEKFVTVFRSDWRKLCYNNGHSFPIAVGFFDAAAEVLKVRDEKEEFTFMLREDYDRLPEGEQPPILEIMSKSGELLTLFAEQAHENKLVELSENFQAFIAQEGINESQISWVKMDNREKILRFLGMNQWIFFVLVLIGLNGLYMEIKAPGFGVAGLTALLCFAIVFGSRYMLGTASSLEIALFVLGILLCVVEIFVLPGFGVAGITGIILIIGALILASFPDFGRFPETELEWGWLKDLTTIVLAGFLSSGILFMIIAPMILRLPFFQAQMVPQMATQDGFVFDTVPDDEALIGRKGKAFGVLRPSGKVRLDDGRVLDVVSNGPFINDGEPVTVVRVDGNRVIVKTREKAGTTA